MLIVIHLLTYNVGGKEEAENHSKRRKRGRWQNFDSTSTGYCSGCYRDSRIAVVGNGEIRADTYFHEKSS